jgi:glycine cleavage system H lipoate-binding protein
VKPVSEYKYAKSHEYIVEDGGVYRVGLSAYAADSLGDITFVEMPEPGAKFAQGAAFAHVESVNGKRLAGEGESIQSLAVVRASVPG